MKRLLGTLWSYFLFTLVLIGITGLTWRMFSEHGWAEQMLGVVWDAEVRNPLIMTPVIGGAVYLSVVFLRGGLRPGWDHLVGSALVFVLSLCGVYFTWQWLFAA